MSCHLEPTIGKEKHASSVENPPTCDCGKDTSVDHMDNRLYKPTRRKNDVKITHVPYKNTSSLSFRPVMFSKNSVIEECDIGDGTIIWHHCNLYRCSIGKNCEIGSFVEIGEGVTIGDNCKILPYAFICPGVEIGSNCFIGPHVVFCNDRYPTVIEHGVEKTIISDNVNIGAGAVILPGISIGQYCTIGAGSIVTKPIQKIGVIAYGNPAKVV